MNKVCLINLVKFMQLTDDIVEYFCQMCTCVRERGPKH